MSLGDSEMSIFTLNSKVKRYLRQTLEDKCSKIGGRQVYFGLDDAMIRMLTPIEEVLTPVPGQLTRPVTPELIPVGNRTSWTLSNPEDYPKSSSEQDLTDVSTHRKRSVLARNNNDDAAQPKSDSTTKPKRHTKKPSSAEQKLDYVDTVTSDRIELPTITIGRKGSNDRKKNPSYGPGNRSGPRVSYNNATVKCTLPPLDTGSSRFAKKSCKSTSSGTIGLPVLPSGQQVHKSARSRTGTTVGTLPPIKSVSGRSTSVQRGSSREVNLIRSLQFHGTREEVRVSQTKPERVDTVRDNISLPSINPNKLPAIDRGVPGGTKKGGKESAHSKRKGRGARGR